MVSKTLQKLVVVAALAALLALVLVVPVRAFESRDGDSVVIAAGEVVPDDLFVAANTFTLEGTVQGDLIVFGSSITIGPAGVVEGDLMAAGSAVTIEGQVQDDVRMAGSALTVGEGAAVTDDLLAAGFSLETRSGSAIGGDLVYAGSQALLAGDIAADVHAAVGGLEIQGTVAGDVNADVGTPADTTPFPPTMFMPNAPPVPSVAGGLTIGQDAQIGGNLAYESRQEFAIPAGIVAGQVLYEEAAPTSGQVEETPQARALDWFLDNLRTLVTLLLVGLLMVWLAPRFTRGGAAILAARPLPSFGWGIVSVFAVFFVLFVLILVVVILAILFGVVTLGDLMGATIWTGLLIAFALLVAFGLAVGYVSKIIVSYLAGRLILSRIRPDWAESRAWAVVIGVLVFTILLAVLSAIWGFLGALYTWIVVLFGLGALWLLVWQRLRPSPAAAATVEPVPGD
jgi:cytoskeletal protein CcmA (bactofilin family)